MYEAAMYTYTILFSTVALMVTPLVQSSPAPFMSDVVTIDTNMPFLKQQETREIFRILYNQHLAENRCKEFAEAYGEMSLSDPVATACLKIPGQAREGFYSIPKDVDYIHLYVVKDDTSYVMGGHKII